MLIHRDKRITVEILLVDFHLHSYHTKVNHPISHWLRLCECLCVCAVRTDTTVTWRWTLLKKCYLYPPIMCTGVAQAVIQTVAQPMTDQVNLFMSEQAWARLTGRPTVGPVWMLHSPHAQLTHVNTSDLREQPRWSRLTTTRPPPPHCW